MRRYITVRLYDGRAVHATTACRRGMLAVADDFSEYWVPLDALDEPSIRAMGRWHQLSDRDGYDGWLGGLDSAA